MLTIRHARLDEKVKAYQWLCKSDTTLMHMGLPDYPESEIPDWTQFENDFEDFYFLESGRMQGSVMIIEKDNEEIGCLCYARFHLKPSCAELDIWLKENRLCGQGFGVTALRQMMDYLKNHYNVTKFLIRPSEKNDRAIRAYEKAGFIRVTNKIKTINTFLLDHFTDELGNGDYGLEQTAVLIKEIE